MAERRSVSGVEAPWKSFPLCEVTTSGLLKMDGNDGEVELYSVKNVELRWNSTTTTTNSGSSIRLSDLTCTVTTHRFIFASSKEDDNVRFIHLSNISHVEESGGNWFTNSKYKILLQLSSSSSIMVVFTSSSSSSRGNDRDGMLKQLQTACQRKAWQDAARLQEQQEQQRTKQRRRVGVDAILKANEAKHKQASKVADKAFHDNDVESLMKEGAELVAIIQSYVKTLEKQHSNNNNNDETPHELANMLSHMGMTSALTKHQSTDEKDYYNKLARHVCDFIYPKILQDSGGMMTLTDVYCLYNRARGTNMISPQDLLQAVDTMSTIIELPTSKRSFPSGLIVIQESTWSDEQMAQTILDLLSSPQQQQQQGITALDLSRALKLSPLLANEHLQASEQLGYLCRDVTLEGIRFYSNLFSTTYQ